MSQLDVIDAAEAVGVQRFVPSEFGDDTLSGNWLRDLEKIMSGKRRVLQHLGEVAGRNEKFSWTGLANGPFIDWVLPLSSFPQLLLAACTLSTVAV